MFISPLTVLLSLTFTLVFSGRPTYGFEGQTEYENEFSFTVLITSSNLGQCSGVAAVNGLVAAAAHCVWNESGLAKNVRITFVDVDRRLHKVGAKEIFVSKDYQDRYMALQKGSSAGGFDRAVTLHDMAFIVPDELVQTPRYANWITEEISRAVSQLDESSDQFRDEIIHITEKLFPRLPFAETYVAGFGYHQCSVAYHPGPLTKQEEQLLERNDCADNSLQYGMGSAQIDLGSDDLSAPWIWCTSGDSVRHGDSGGPLFLASRLRGGSDPNRGEWLRGWVLVGFISEGTKRSQCASSMLSNLPLYLHARAAAISAVYDHGWKGSQNYLKAHMKYFLGDFFEQLRAPSEAITSALRPFYASTVYSGGKTATVEAFLAEKKAFATIWDDRLYELPSDPITRRYQKIGDDAVTVHCGSSDEMPCRVTAVVNWRITKNSDRKYRTGQSKYELTILPANRRGRDVPVILSEDGRVVRH